MSTTVTIEDVGFTATSSSPLSVEQTGIIGAALDHPGRFAAGDTLPFLWHWAHFTPRVATAHLGADGHPPIPVHIRERYPLRMWASGSVEAPGKLVVGEPAERRSSIAAIKETEGGTGPLLIVTVEHVHRQFGADQIVERQSLVYKTLGAPVSLPEGDHRPVPEPGQWQVRRQPTPVELFRFSAVTFNSHRIHYDEAYAHDVEGYPALVVHGPLTAIAIATAIADHAGRDLTRFDFRGKAPLFVGLPSTVVGTPDGDQVTAQAIRNDGVVASDTTATLGAARPPATADPS